MRFLRSKKVDSQDDTSLIEAYKASSDSRYLGILFDRYCHLAFAVAMKYMKNEDDSKDVVLQVFEHLSADLKKYEVRNFGNWLYSIVKNHCIRLLKKKRFSKEFDDEHTRADEADEDKIEQEELTVKMLSFLDEAIDSLNHEQQTCVKLFYFEDKSYNEIVVMTGYTYDKVKSHIQNGKRNLKIYLLKRNDQR